MKNNGDEIIFEFLFIIILIGSIILFILSKINSAHELEIAEKIAITLNINSNDIIELRRDPRDHNKWYYQLRDNDNVYWIKFPND